MSHATRRFRRLAARAAALAATLGVVACDVSVAEEDELGDRYATALEAQLPILADSASTAWLSALGDRITRVADDARRDWHWYLVDDSTVNAFAVPGGHIFVHRGLVERAGSLSEFAGVMGHEVAHVTLRHSVDQLKSRTKANVVVTIVCAVVNVCSSTVAQVALDVGGQALFAKYSRDDESQADSAAVGYLVAAGIDPRGIPSLFARLATERQADPTALDAWFGSHPLEASRIARTRAVLDTFSDAALDGLESSDTSFAAFQASVRALGRTR